LSLQLSDKELICIKKMNDIKTISLTSILLLIWFQTEAVIYYAKAFKLTKLFKIDQFESDKENDFTLEYPFWLNKSFPGFFTKLLSCPWCIGAWICLSSSLLYGTIDLIFLNYLISMIVYFVVVNKVL
jgi:hypothetical protein